MWFRNEITEQVTLEVKSRIPKSNTIYDQVVMFRSELINLVLKFHQLWQAGFVAKSLKLRLPFIDMGSLTSPAISVVEQSTYLRSCGQNSKIKSVTTIRENC